MCSYILVYTCMKECIKFGHKILICAYFKVVEFQVIFILSILANVTQLISGRARIQCSCPIVSDPRVGTLTQHASSIGTTALVRLPRQGY